MKRKWIIACVLAAFLTVQLFMLSACNTTYYKTRSFDSLTELQAEIGPSLLFPSDLPENFTPDSSTFTSFIYLDSETWEYKISYSNSAYDDDEARFEIPLSQLAIERITIRCYEPQHQVPINAHPYDKYDSSMNHIESFEKMFARKPPDLLFDLEGAEVIYFPNPSSYDNEAGYRFMTSETLFMNDNILYCIDIRCYANEAMDYEEFLEYCSDLAKFMVRNLLSQE